MKINILGCLAPLMLIYLGNKAQSGTQYMPRQYDVVIDEIMADPTPMISLPGNEWIELRNTSGSEIDLQGWKIGTASGQSGPMPGFILMPDSLVIICSGSAATSMAAFGKTLAVPGFPSLDNRGGLLFLRSPADNIIHAVGYSDNWYRNELKKEGGWTLEMIDTRNPCGGAGNWTAGIDIKGGSPGIKNSVDAVNTDINMPKLLRAYTTDSMNMVLVFDEQLDSEKTVATINFMVSDGIGSPIAVIAQSPLLDRVGLKLNTSLLRNKIYTVTVKAVSDCAGNVIGNENTARVGLPEIPGKSDIIVNEILFNPPPGGTDYVEVYNRGNKIIDLRQFYIANRNNSGAISSIAQCSAESYLLFPGDFMVVTEDTLILKTEYITQNAGVFMKVVNMPSFNDDRGSAIILNAQGEIADELDYEEDWHFKLVGNREGVALERIDYNAPTQSRDNWHSAATSTGYGTPGYKNSQYRINHAVQAEINLSPEIVSPDNDGQDDFATLDYNFAEPGYVANTTIFDASGRPVRTLQRNALCGTKGSFRWDGLGEKSQRLATGVYVLFTEVFNLKGQKKQFKNVIVLARRN